MKSLKINIKPLSSFRTKLQSDTIFGQFCWMYGYVHGFDRLEDALRNINDNGFVAFSDAFVGDLIPKPLVEPRIFKDNELRVAKDYKKTEYIGINKEFLEKVRKGLKDEDIFRLYESETRSKNVATVVEADTLKNSVNRITGTTNEGQLYGAHEMYFEDDVCISMYVKYNQDIISKSEVLDIIEKMGIVGFGKAASTGKGRFKIKDDDGDMSVIDNPKELEWFDGANAFMTLSHGIPGFCGDNPDCKLNYGKIITKFPKHGGFLSNNDYFKNPFIAYKPGSTFLFNANSCKKDVYGTVINNISRHGKNHVQGTFLMPFFIRI